LILPGRSWLKEGKLSGNVRERIRVLEGYCREVANKYRSKLLKDLVNDAPAASMPIFRWFDFRQRWKKELVPIEDYAELSRLVVDPEYRGTNVSRLLIRVVIAAAIDLGRKRLLLECAPFHGPMYEKYGFKTMDDKDGTRYFSRVQDLDVEGQGMRLDLEQAKEHAEVAAARRLLNAAVGRLAPLAGQPKSDNRGSRFCCLCGKKNCWGDGEYPFWSGSECPLNVLVPTAT
jgi:GNAT superfamily N-acetyltransferase